MASVTGVVLISSGSSVSTVGIGRTVHRGLLVLGANPGDGLGRYFGV